jgi:hypothetical protein
MKVEIKLTSDAKWTEVPDPRCISIGGGVYEFELRAGAVGSSKPLRPVSVRLDGVEAQPVELAGRGSAGPGRTLVWGLLPERPLEGWCAGREALPAALQLARSHASVVLQNARRSLRPALPVARNSDGRRRARLARSLLETGDEREARRPRADGHG